VTDELHLGASLLNLGGPTLTLRETPESIPEELRAGAALHLFGGRALISGEMRHREGPGLEGAAGAEAWLHERLALRAGYHAGEVAGGFSYRLPAGWQVDYGVSDHELGVVHRFGLCFRFGGFHASAQAYPAVFSPTGRQPVTKFQLDARTRDEARNWELTIHGDSEVLVRTFGGEGLPPAQVIWDGKDQSGLPLPDGVYRYHLIVRDAVGRELVSRERSVEIFTGGPSGSVPVVID
jgi:hypothetical protein